MQVRYQVSNAYVDPTLDMDVCRSWMTEYQVLRTAIYNSHRDELA
jgi:hypothetical protein